MDLWEFWNWEKILWMENVERKKKTNSGAWGQKMEIYTVFKFLVLYYNSEVTH